MHTHKYEIWPSSQVRPFQRAAQAEETELLSQPNCDKPGMYLIRSIKTNCSAGVCAQVILAQPNTTNESTAKNKQALPRNFIVITL